MKKILFIIPTASDRQPDNIRSFVNMDGITADSMSGRKSVYYKKKNRDPLLKFFTSVPDEMGSLYDDIDYIICMHDDVWLIDIGFDETVEAAFEDFDYWGVVGTNLMLVDDPRWHVPFGSRKHTYGLMEHQRPDGIRFMTSFGPYPAKASVVDGVFMAFKREVFDRLVDVPKLDGFHMYDMEMCTQAWDMGYKGGVYGLHLFHESRGEGILTDDWARHARTYSDRWKKYKLIGDVL
jgi:GT2 family glycosyltransferase